MKKLAILVPVYLVILGGCTSKELSREEAFRLVQQGKHYPELLDYDIYCGDPVHAKKVIDAGLEAQGLLTVDRTQKLSEIGSPLIHFTNKAKPYLLPTPESDKSSNIQKVKLADEELAEVTGIKTSGNGKNAVVEYTTVYKNITPFAALVGRDLKKKELDKGYFSLYDDGWKYEKKPGVEFIEFEK